MSSEHHNEDHRCESDCGHDHHGHAHAHGEHHHDHSHDHGAAVALATLDRRFFFHVGTVLVALWGAVMVYFFATGRVTHYLTGSGTFRIQCLLTGLALCVLAAFNFLTARRREAPHGPRPPTADAEAEAAECAEDHDHVHDESSWIGKVISFLVLAVPLATAALYSPDRYSDTFTRLKVNAVATTSTAALGSGGIDLRKRSASSDAVVPSGAEKKAAAPAAPGAFSVEELERLSGGRSPEGNIRLQLVELFYMPAQTPDVRDVVASQPIETVGQAIKDTNNPARMRLFRLMMTCCAADARPISIPVEFVDAAPEWREMNWYKVAGTIEYRDENGTPTAVLKAKSVTSEKPPRNQMMF
ncbi:MAG: TIGR03943 family putative permease subunit [Verrucomicrobiales bacterium]